MDINITLHILTLYFLIVARIIGTISAAPIFNNKQIFSLGRMAFIIWFSALLLFVVPVPETFSPNMMDFVLMFVVEVMKGMIIGFVADLFVIAIEFAGSIMDTQAGLSVASLLDPSSGRNITLISQFLKWTAIIIFLQLDGHHMILSVLHKSFEILPIGVINTDMREATQMLFSLGGDVFKIGVLLSAPVLLVVFIVDFAFGLLNKIAEQVNVFQLGFQIKPSVALLIFMGVTPAMVNNVYGIMEHLTEEMLKILLALQG